MAEVIVGLKKLHESGYLHADLKLENVMKATDGHIKLIDFGLSRDWKTWSTTVPSTARESILPPKL